MAIALIGQVNILELPLVAKASGDPIVSGTVNFYLKDKDGPNVGKWYRGSDQTWQSSISVAGAATHDDDGHWYLSFPSAVWTKNVRYSLHAKESGNLHISTGKDVLGVEKSELALHTDLDSYANKDDWKSEASKVINIDHDTEKTILERGSDPTFPMQRGSNSD